jgi:hypothetical protein
MTAEYVGSIAFREARLKSERLRIWIVLGAIGAVLLLRFMRAVAVGGREMRHLRCKHKVRWRLPIPTLDSHGRWRSVERAIDLHRAELLRVMLSSA